MFLADGCCFGQPHGHQGTGGCFRVIVPVPDRDAGDVPVSSWACDRNRITPPGAALKRVNLMSHLDGSSNATSLGLALLCFILLLGNSSSGSHPGNVRKWRAFSRGTGGVLKCTCNSKTPSSALTSTTRQLCQRLSYYYSTVTCVSFFSFGSG